MFLTDIFLLIPEKVENKQTVKQWMKEVSWVKRGYQGNYTVSTPAFLELNSWFCLREKSFHLPQVDRDVFPCSPDGGGLEPLVWDSIRGPK